MALGLNLIMDSLIKFIMMTMKSDTQEKYLFIGVNNFGIANKV